MDDPIVPTEPLEVPVPPLAIAAPISPLPVAPAQTWVLGPYTSVQVNVDAGQNNIVGDAANEPTIAIDPLNPQRIVIGWRQFTTISSNFREAGVGYSHDGGATWTKYTLTPGQFRSDPVMGADNNGNFYYSTLPNVNTVEVFKSIDGGVTWGPPVYAFGGDKQWMTVDRSGGMGDGNIHQYWNVQFTCCPPNDYTRSVNGGASFPAAYALPTPSMKWGTLDVGPDGVLHFGGSNLGQSGHLTTRCTNCNNGAAAPVFAPAQSVNLGGTANFSTGPNPGGLLGQVTIATDHSTGATRGNVYMLSSVNPPGADPLDVMFIRSTDGGVNWTAPIRVNDDPVAATSYQWFGTMSVAPNGRIDVVWNDTRNDPNTGDTVFISELFYSYSLDAGVTWSPNTPVSPAFNPHVGYPSQNKLGDYYHTISDALGVNVAYAATFNGEQDVYFLRIVIDCNNNGIPDPTDIADCTGDPTCGDCNANGAPDECDIASTASDDTNANSIPDECEPPSIIWDFDPLSNRRTTRTLIFSVGPPVVATATPGQSAIKVTMVDLEHPVPGYQPTVNPLPKNFSIWDTNLNGTCGNGDHAGHHCDTNADCRLCGGTGFNLNRPCTSDADCTAGGQSNFCPSSVCTGDARRPCATNTNCTGFGSCGAPITYACGGLAACTGEAAMSAVGVGGCGRWVGKPETFREAQLPVEIGNYLGARLQCTPYYHDWVAATATEPVAVFGAEILPNSTYSVLAYGASCKGNEGSCTNVSAPVEMLTRRAGDVVLLYNPPDSTQQPDVTDISQAVRNFRKDSGAPSNTHVLIQPNVPDPNSDMSVSDLVQIVDMAKQFAYPFGGPCPCPSLAVCGAVPCPNGNLDCSSSGAPGLGAEAVCVKLCRGGTNAGEQCNNHLHCGGGGICDKECVGGTNNGQGCTGNTDCGKVCVSGPTPGASCFDASTCGGGTCPTINCGIVTNNAFCRDRCGRCTP